MRSFLSFGLAGTCLTVLLGCTTPPAQIVGPSTPTQPEAATGYQPKPGWASTRFAVAAANPLAVDAGYRVLKAGGSAVDAAIAVQMVLGLVEPQSSGIGGGAFLLHFDGRTVAAFDGRETAPAAADEALFLDANGKPLAFYEAVVGGRSVGTPGVLRMLELAHRAHGKLPWASLFEPAIVLAEQGFVVSPRLAALLKSDPYLRQDATAAAYFYPAGQALPAGTRLKNLAYAAILRQIASQGAAGLMQGPVAQAVVNKVRTHPGNPGSLSLDDLARYQPRQREALCSDYAAQKVDGRVHDYRLCGMPPPSSGAIAVAQILGLLSHTPAHALAWDTRLDEPRGPVPSADFLHLYTEAARLAYADRAQYLGDPDFVAAPGGNWSRLIAPGYLAQRARLINSAPNAPSMKTALPGDPGALPVALAPMPDQVEHGTSHISIVDADGHALAMTTTIEDAFGARIMSDGGTGLVGGFLLNNQLTDFSFAPTDGSGRPIANRVQANKRPRSSMAPTLVFERASDGGNGTWVASLGSPGGAMIIHFTAKTLYGILNRDLNPQQAIDLPNFGSLNGPSLLESGRFSPGTVQQLRARGAEVREIEIPSGLQAIMKTPSGYFGGADPRREGVVRGD